MLNIRRTAWRWVPGLVAANVTLIGIELGVFQSLQSLATNILFQMRGAIEWDERVVVVEIDDQSI
jgi:CHASE2 domain-containing sensor protein